MLHWFDPVLDPAQACAADACGGTLPACGRNGRGTGMRRMIKGKKMDEILRFERVWYRYEEGRMALTDFSVTVRAGERIAVLGENGAGKSTFFLLANGVLRPEKGTVLWNGIPIGDVYKRQDCRCPQAAADQAADRKSASKKPPSAPLFYRIRCRTANG